LLTLAQQNRADEQTRRRLAWVLALTGGMLIMNFALFLTEYSEGRMMHSAVFYRVTAAAFPLALATMGRAIKLRWAATSAAACFTLLMLALMWFIELFPATPKLGPIFQHITHMVTLSFPLLVIVPAFFFDLVLHRFDGKLGTFALASILGVTFVVTFVAAQWTFATFLVESPLARGRLFNADNYVYWMSPRYEALEHRFDPPDPGSWPLAVHLLIAMGIATITSAIGLARGRWMTRVRR
jgi:hypothetical protein